MGDLQCGGTLDIAAVGRELAANGREQARLTRAVGAGEADFVAAEDGEIDLLEQRLRTAPQGQIPSRQQDLRPRLTGGHRP
jgi:hypothetical protein